MQTLWVFALTSTNFEANTLLNAVKQNLEGLKSHGKALPLTVTLEEGRFIVVKDASNQATGCSIDKIQHIVRDVLEVFGLAIAPASDVFYKTSSGSIAHLDFRAVPQALITGLINPDTPVFDPQAIQQNDLSNWIKPLKATFLARYIQNIQTPV